MNYLFKKIFFFLLLKTRIKNLILKSEILKQNFFKIIQEEKEQPNYKDNFFSDYVEHNKIIQNNSINILDIGCSEGPEKIYENYNFFNYYGIDCIDKEVSKLKKKFKKKRFNFYLYFLKNCFIDLNKFSKKHFNFSKTLAFDFIDKFYKKKKNKIYDQLNNKKKLNLVKQITVDQFLRKYKINYINFFKIDIDGFTNPVLKNSKTILKSPNLFLIKCEVNYTNPLAKDYFLNTFNILKKYNFDLYRLTTRQYLHKGYLGKFIYNFPSQNYEGVDQQGDLFFIKKLNLKKISLSNLIKYLVILEIFNFNDLCIFQLNSLGNNKKEKLNKFKNLLIKRSANKIFKDKNIEYKYLIKLFYNNKL